MDGQRVSKYAPYLALRRVLARYRTADLSWNRGQKTRTDTAAIRSSRAESINRIARWRRSSETEVGRHCSGVEQPAALEPRDEVTRDANQLLAVELAAREIPLVSSAQAISENGGQRLFRDAFHPNPDGNRVLAELVADAIVRQVRSGLRPPR